MKKLAIFTLFTLGLVADPGVSYPYAGDDYRYVVKDYASPGAHQLASWIASQLRTKDIVPPQDLPVLHYRVPLQGKRNSEVSNAIIGSEETQKMYRDGRK